MTDLEIPGLVDVAEIGRGGYGVVYRARQVALDRFVAVKMLNVSLHDEASMARFSREGRAMGPVSGHPNVVVLYQYGVTPSGTPYLMLEYLPKGALADRISADGPLSIDEATATATHLTGALETAHRAGVLHRDLKPDNIFVGHFGEPKLGDFGIARLDSSMTGTQGLTASPAHAPPELIAGKRVTVQSDVYSLASTTYELLCGKPAFVRETDESMLPLLARLVQEDPPELTPYGVPQAVQDVVFRGMAKDPADRPATAYAFGEEINAARRQVGFAPVAIRVLDVSPSTSVGGVGAPADTSSSGTGARPGNGGAGTMPVVPAPILGAGPTTPTNTPASGPGAEPLAPAAPLGAVAHTAASDPGGTGTAALPGSIDDSTGAVGTPHAPHAPPPPQTPTPHPFEATAPNPAPHLAPPPTPLPTAPSTPPASPSGGDGRYGGGLPPAAGGQPWAAAGPGATASPAPSSRRAFWILGGAAFVAIAVIAIAIVATRPSDPGPVAASTSSTAGSSSTSTSASTTSTTTKPSSNTVVPDGDVSFGKVTVTGSSLPSLPSRSGSDPAVGKTAPRLRGEQFDGSSIVLPDRGKPAVIMDLAHWCSHCQRNVVKIVNYLNDHGMPADVNLYAVVSQTNEKQENYPPGDWLRRENWPVPTLVDDNASAAATAYGVNDYTYFTVIGADGRVISRTVGEVTTEQFAQLIEDAKQ